jgi:large subunit ribosomal protein L5
VLAMAKKKTEKTAETAAQQGVAPRLLERYEKEILPALAEKLGRTNRHSLPRLQKIVLNMGVGSAVTEKKHIEEAVAALQQITGQKPLVTKSRQAIAGFKLREGMPIGAKVTIRGTRMYEFLDRLISLALPRVRDFRGLNPNGFDGRGNYSLGLSEQLVFPELNPDKFLRPQGMNITLVMSSVSNDESRELLRGFGMPFKVEEVSTKKSKVGAA